MNNKYEEMSDFEISKEIAIYKGLKICRGQSYIPIVSHWDSDGYLSTFSINNPSDMWPIIVENEISLIRDVSTNDVWMAIGKAWFTSKGIESSIGDSIECINKNPLRAAAIVFLMMKDA